MKTIYKQPDCELHFIIPEMILCLSGDGTIDGMPSGSVDDGDYEPIY